MYVVNIDDLNGTERDIVSDNWRSRRMVLAREGVGFSFHETTLFAGTTSTFHYQTHIEGVYCVGGSGTITNEETGEVHELRDGTMYLLDKHDKHTVRTEHEMRMVCVFNPPVTGREVHDENGVYPALNEDGTPVS